MTQILRLLVIASLCLTITSCKQRSENYSLQTVDSNSATTLSERELQQEAQELTLPELLAEAEKAHNSAVYSALWAAGKVNYCMETQGFKGHAKYVGNTLRGFVLDGFGSDVCIAVKDAWKCGTEAVRFAVSTHNFGRWFLKKTGIKTSDEVLVEKLQRDLIKAAKAHVWLSQHGDDLALYTARMKHDPLFRTEQSLQIYRIIAIALAETLQDASRQDCNSILSGVARAHGAISYELSLTVGLGIVTAEFAGAGAALKVGQVIYKLSKLARETTNPAVRALCTKITEALHKLSRLAISEKHRSSTNKGDDAGKDSESAPNQSDDSVKETGTDEAPVEKAESGSGGDSDNPNDKDPNGDGNDNDNGDDKDDESPDSDGSVRWGMWTDLEKVTVDGREYAKINDRLYTRHAIDRMTPTAYGEAFGTPDSLSRGVPTMVVEETIKRGKVISRTTQPDGSIREVRRMNTVQVVTENDGNIVVTVLRKSSDTE